MTEHPRGPRRDHPDHRHPRPARGGPGQQVPWLPRLIFEGLRAAGPAMRRGEIRPLILAALAQKPMHGYEVIQELEAQSGGRWRPSAGSVYPTLQLLSDEALVTSEEIDGRRTYSLTDAGRKAVADAPARGSRWSHDSNAAAMDIRAIALQLVGGVLQVQKMGSPAAQREARKILVEARRGVYQLLADDGDTAADAEPTGQPDVTQAPTDPGDASPVDSSAAEGSAED